MQHQHRQQQRQRGASASTWAAPLLWLLAAWHARVVVPLVNWWEGCTRQAEESAVALIRESFGLVARALNDGGAWALSLLDRSYAETQRRARAQQAAWQRWWREEDRASALNAVVAGASGGGGGGGEVQPADSGSTPSGSQQQGRWPSVGRWSLDGGAGGGSAAAAAAAPASPSPWSLSGLWQRRRQRRPSSSAGGHPAGSATPRGSSGGGGSSTARRRGHAHGGTPSSQSGTPRGRARRGSWGPGGARRAAVDAAGWWAAYGEALGPPGLLEDARLSLEVGVARAFDALRWLVRRATLSLRAGGGGSGPVGGGGGGGDGVALAGRASGHGAAAGAASPSPGVRPRRSGAAPDGIQPPPPLKLRPPGRRQAGDERPAATGGDGTAGGLAGAGSWQRLWSQEPWRQPPGADGSGGSGGSEEDEEEEEDDDDGGDAGPTSALAARVVAARERRRAAVAVAAAEDEDGGAELSSSPTPPVRRQHRISSSSSSTAASSGEPSPRRSPRSPRGAQRFGLLRSKSFGGGVVSSLCVLHTPLCPDS